MSRFSSSDEDQPVFGLNMIPIVGCLTVLITYLLASTSFTTIDAIDGSISSVDTKNPTARTPASVFAKVTRDGRVLFEVNHSGQTAHLEALSGGAGTRGAEIRKRWPAITEVSLKADPSVPYKTILKTITELDQSFSKVYFGE